MSKSQKKKAKKKAAAGRKAAADVESEPGQEAASSNGEDLPLSMDAWISLAVPVHSPRACLPHCFYNHQANDIMIM